MDDSSARLENGSAGAKPAVTELPDEIAGFGVFPAITHARPCDQYAWLRPSSQSHQIAGRFAPAERHSAGHRLRPIVGAAGEARPAREQGTPAPAGIPRPCSRLPSRQPRSPCPRPLLQPMSKGCDESVGWFSQCLVPPTRARSPLRLAPHHDDFERIAFLRRPVGANAGKAAIGGRACVGGLSGRPTPWKACRTFGTIQRLTEIGGPTPFPLAPLSERGGGGTRAAVAAAAHFGPPC